MRVLLLLGLMLAIPSFASAEPAARDGNTHFRLRWSAPADCPSERDVNDEARRLLGGSKLTASSKPLEVSARVSASAQGFELELELGPRPSRTRTLAAPTCAELGHAAALVVALAIDPSLKPAGGDVSANVVSGEAAAAAGAARAMEKPCPEPSALPECAPPPAPLPPPSPWRAPVITPAPAPCPRCERESVREDAAHRYVLLAGSGVAYGVLPQVLPRVGLGAAYQSGAHWLELSASAAYAASSPRGDGSGASFVLGLVAPRYCARAKVGFGTLGACGVVELGASSASGFGVEEPNTRLSGWIAAGAGVKLGVPLAGGAELLVAGDLLVVTTRTRYELDGSLLYRPNLLVPALRLGLAAGI